MSKTKSRSTPVNKVGCVNRTNSGFANEIYSVQSSDFAFEQARQQPLPSSHAAGVVANAIVINHYGDASHSHAEFDQRFLARYESSQSLASIYEAAYKEFLICQFKAIKRDLPPGIQTIIVHASSKEPDQRDNQRLNWFQEVSDRRPLFRGRLYSQSGAKLEEQKCDTPPEDTAKDTSANLKQRYDAILHWLLENKPAASQYVLHELANSTGAWRDALVHAAMDTWFDARGDQEKLVGLLLEIADTRRQETDASSASVTRTAILRAGSLMGSSQLDRFLPFFGQSKTILATLIAMQRIVTNDPPQVEQSSSKLLDELRDLTRRYSDPQVHERGKIGAALMNAMTLLAILDVERFLEAVDDMARLNKPWLLEHLLRDLKAIQQSPKWQTLTGSQMKAGVYLVRAMEIVNQAVG